MPAAARQMTALPILIFFASLSVLSAETPVFTKDFSDGDLTGWTSEGGGNWVVVQHEGQPILQHSGPPGPGTLSVKLPKTLDQGASVKFRQGWLMGDGAAQCLGVGLINSATGDGYIFTIRSDAPGFKYGLLRSDGGQLVELKVDGQGPNQVGNDPLVESELIWDKATGTLIGLLDGEPRIEIGDERHSGFDTLVLYDRTETGEGARFGAIEITGRE